MLVTLSTLLHGTLSEKLIWIFRLYDLNDDGEITKTEFGNVVVAVHQLMGIEFTAKVSSIFSIGPVVSLTNRLWRFDFTFGNKSNEAKSFSKNIFFTR